LALRAAFSARMSEEGGEKLELGAGCGNVEGTEVDVCDERKEEGSPEGCPEGYPEGGRF